MGAAIRSNDCSGDEGRHRIFSKFESLDVMFIAFISIALIADRLRLC
jgi:hypothetical protein